MRSIQIITAKFNYKYFRLPNMHSTIKVLFAIGALASMALATEECKTGGTFPCLTGTCEDPAEKCIAQQGAAASDPKVCCAAADVVVVTPVPAPIPKPAPSPVVSTCVDLKNPSTGVSDCPKRASLCNDATYMDLMTVQCPKTCGRCNSNGGGTTTTCVDKTNPSTGRSDCAANKNLCNNATYKTLMPAQCPKTCGLCSGTGTNTGTGTGTTCVDKTGSNGQSNCSQMSAYCTNSIYRDLMSQQCPKTCGLC